MVERANFCFQIFRFTHRLVNKNRKCFKPIHSLDSYSISAFSGDLPRYFYVVLKVNPTSSSIHAFQSPYSAVRVNFAEFCRWRAKSVQTAASAPSFLVAKACDELKLLALKMLENIYVAC